ncbi:MAG: ABC transporter ATP-binding protein [Gammaproteobacteria bacterium]|nr:MAG: ABC transporter ATP-binding protein [Gammaproteobacteria bacterium]
MKRLLAEHITLKAANKLICRDLTLTLQAGEIWGILGQNGSGKTTLLHALAGLHPLTSGQIWLGQHTLSALTPKTIAKQRAILFQDTHPTFSLSVREYCLTARYPHLSYFKKPSTHDQHIIDQALEVVELTAHQQQAITTLSGGEKRRLAIAAVLAQTPLIYLLDEPTNHLDMRHQISVLQHFRQLAQQQGISIIMSLHDANLARQFCDQVLLLFANGVAQQGHVEELLATENLRRLYYF